MNTDSVDAELREQFEATLHEAVRDLGMTVLFRDSDPVKTGVGDKHPPYYWTDRLLTQARQQDRDKQVHLSHCYQGEYYSDGCKYGEDDCPAKEDS